MDNEVILKVNLEDQLDDQKALIEQVAEEFHEKCLLSYGRTHDSVIQKTPLPSVLLHGQSEDVEARTTRHLVHKTVHEAFTNHNKVLATTTGNVLKEVFFRAPVDQVGPSYFNGYNPLTIESGFPSSSQQPNGGQCQQ
jgi:hypothetical protein